MIHFIKEVYMNSKAGEISDLDLLSCFMLKGLFELRPLNLKIELYFKRFNRVEKPFREEERE